MTRWSTGVPSALEGSASARPPKQTRTNGRRVAAGGGVRLALVDGFQVFGRGFAVLALLELVFDALAFLKAGHSSALDR